MTLELLAQIGAIIGIAVGGVVAVGNALIWLFERLEKL
jgi:hypothetical protein